MLVDALRPRRLLLVLDNCEHVVQASAELVHGVLRGCPGVSVLATSREPLGIVGENTRRVAPLAYPESGSQPKTEQLLTYQSVRLFIERARAAANDFSLGASTAPAVARMCARVDGVPLALELAAAWLRVFSPEQIDPLEPGGLSRTRLYEGEPPTDRNALSGSYAMWVCNGDALTHS